MYLILVFLPLIGSIIAGLFGRKLGPNGSSIITVSCLMITFSISVFAFYEVSVTTLAPRPVLNDDLREIAIERLRNGDFRLPIRNNVNGLPAGDVEEMRNLNASLDEESIRNILESIAENRFNQEVFGDILSHFSPEFLDRTRNILSQSYNTLQDFAPILNIMIYANVGFYDFNASSINLANLLSDINPPVEIYENNLENNLEEVVNSIEENVNSANDDAERRNEEYNQERSSIIN